MISLTSHRVITRTCTHSLIKAESYIALHIGKAMLTLYQGTCNKQPKPLDICPNCCKCYAF